MPFNHSASDLRTVWTPFWGCCILREKVWAHFLSNAAEDATVNFFFFTFVKELSGVIVNPKFLPVSLCKRALPMVTDKLQYSAAHSFAEPNWPVYLFMEPDQCVRIFPCRFWAAVSARSGETLPISADWEPELQHPGGRCWGLAEPQCRTVDCEWQGWGGSTRKHREAMWIMRLK